MIRYLLLGIPLTFVFIVIGLVLQDKSSPTGRESRSAKPSIAGNEQQSPASNKAFAPPRDSHLDTIIAPLPPVEVEDPLASLPLPRAEREDPLASLPLPWAEREDPIPIPTRFERLGLAVSALKINPDYFSSLRAGDRVLLPIPQLGQSYEMRVERIQRHPNGDRSIKGHLLDTEIPYSFIMTEGRLSSFATINTPDGSYTLEAEGENAWMISLADLDLLIDVNVEDYEIPDISRPN